ncbi:MAG: DUF58 domain-containing protein [Pseudohongiella sp.]|nr:DUF58 domain-containing protein [Pseudohongiella sp.]MDO9520234.1 DUF58 domain-containing protein [Pseudohongiella sp.]MDP2127039.1 DUF58 domain-containing protein [Pseudohongiella sp.]
MDTQYRRRFRDHIKWRFERWHLDWLSRRVPASHSVKLGRRNIYILPVGQGMLFIATALAVFIGAANYELSLAFALSFLMISVFLLTVLHTFSNLQGLTLNGFDAEPCFAGDNAIFKVRVQRTDKRARDGVSIGAGKAVFECFSLVENTVVEVFLPVPAVQRGRMKAPRLMIQTVFPLGLWQAWARPDLNMSCLVYPQPQQCELPSIHSRADDGEHSSSVTGHADFYGLRDYQPGDTRRQIAWKSLARGQGLKTKQFSDPCDREVMLDWSMFAGAPDEVRLSCLCYLVLQMSEQGIDFGLRLPGLMFAPDRGERHKHSLLEALALWS